ncbi:MAG: hypothetical protein M3464_02355 [Chloroflexota bacterium]|nr:hypothetical protein [Chloroflexota bacterium]
MSNFPEPVDTETYKLIIKNIDLAFAFVREVIADPTRLDDIPSSGSIVVILPPDDPDLAATNLAIAERLAADGKTVIVKQVGVAPITDEGWERLNAKLPAWAPVWATDVAPEAATVVYDQQRDALLVDLAGGRRHGWGWPLNDLVYLLLDDETEEAFAYLIPHFLSNVVARVPELTKIMAVADLRPLSDGERGHLQVLEMPSANGAEGTHSATALREARADFLADIRQLTNLSQAGS